MGSTGLITYLNYISNWSLESYKNIECLISEFKAFLKLKDLNPDPIIDEEFTKLVSLATTVRDVTIAADATQLAADAAAVAMIWTFGLSMAVYAALEVTEIIERAVISDKSAELNKKLKDLDVTLASKMGSNVKAYITKYKANNKIIVEQATELDKNMCRSYLMQFMANVQRKATSFDVATFRRFARAARIMYNSKQIQAVYAQLDKYVLGNKNDDDTTALMKVTAQFLDDLHMPSDYSCLITGEVLSTMLSAKVTPEHISKVARRVGYPIEEVDDAAVSISESVGTFTAVVGVVLGIVNSVLIIINIVDVVHQYDKWIAELDGPIRKHYKDFYNGLCASSKKYRKAVGLD